MFPFTERATWVTRYALGHAEGVIVTHLEASLIGQLADFA